MPQRPTVVAFDVVETLFSLASLGPRIEKTGLPAEALQLWFSRFLRDAFAFEAAGVYQPFRPVAQAALEGVLAQRGLEVDAEKVQHVLEGFAELAPHPDVQPAFAALRAAGVRILALTNGSEATTRGLVERAGLAGDVERYVSIDDVRHWKPNAAVYLHAAKTAGVDPAQLALVAAHSWDILGARQAGLVTGWVSRSEKRFASSMGSPDVSGATLVEVVNGLLALWQGGSPDHNRR